MIPDKERIERRFSDAAVNYSASASFQKQSAEDFAELLRTLPPCHGILEAGCGTGFLTRKIRDCFPSAKLYASDLSEEMLAVCRGNCPDPGIHFFRHDFDQPFDLPEPCDLAVSALSLQWSHRPDQAFRNISKALKPGGRVLFSIPLHGSLPELKELFAREGAAFPGLPLPHRDELEQRFEVCFREMSTTLRHYVEEYPDLYCFLKTMRKNGTAAGNAETSPALLRKLIRENQDRPMRVHYDVLFLAGRNPNS